MLGDNFLVTRDEMAEGESGSCFDERNCTLSVSSHQSDACQFPKLRLHILQYTVRIDLRNRKAFPRTTELLQRNHALIKLLVFSHNNFLVVTLSDNDTSITPTEVVHAPK